MRFIFLLLNFTVSFYTYADIFTAQQTINPSLPGMQGLGDGFGQTVKMYDKWLFIAAPLASPDGKAGEGAIYVYRKKDNSWYNTQIITTNGTCDHLGDLQIEMHDKWLFISSIGTPIGSISNDLHLEQDFTGALLIYRYDPADKQWKFYQSIDRSLPGLAELSVMSQPVIPEEKTAIPENALPQVDNSLQNISEANTSQIVNIVDENLSTISTIETPPENFPDPSLSLNNDPNPNLTSNSDSETNVEQNNVPEADLSVNIESNSIVETLQASTDQVAEVSGKIIEPILETENITDSNSSYQNQNDFTSAIQEIRPEQQIIVPSQDITEANLTSNENLSDTNAPASQIADSVQLPFMQNQQGACFGLRFAVDLKSKIMLVGAQYQQGQDITGNALANSGAVYAFKLNEKNQWTLVQKITNPDGMTLNDNFGANIAVKGRFALISNASVFNNPRLGSNSSVYVYFLDNGQWNLLQKLNGDQQGPTSIISPVFGNISVGDAFGSSFAIDDRWAVIGASLESKEAGGQLSGAAYFYRFGKIDGTKQLVRTQKVVSDDPAALGTAFLHVALQGDTALISDPTRGGPAGPAQGGIMVFRLKEGNWQHINTLYDPNGQAFGYFGVGVAKHDKFYVGGDGVSIAGQFFSAIGNPVITPPALSNGDVVIFTRKPEPFVSGQSGQVD